ncbi:MAG: class I SAM-dependent methyltransferase [Sulfitobacter sp.]
MIPLDFLPEVYLRLNPDVAAAGVDPVEHFLEYGYSEGRTYSEVQASQDPVSEFASGLPTKQAIADIFSCEWSSEFPSSFGIKTEPGHAKLFIDDRIVALEQNLGPVAGKSVLELGPLEAAHTFMLHEFGAAQITSVESNKRAFLKCLAVKEIFSLSRASFLLGDGNSYLEQTEDSYDVILASGILYHMTDPLRLLSAITARTDRVFLWTHYYDEEILRKRSDWSFFDEPHKLRPGKNFYGAKRSYPETALSWTGFSGGDQPHAVWMTRQSILDFFDEQGFSNIIVEFDAKDHPNGPSFAVSAFRK